MPGTNAGTGQPLFFMCFRARQRKDWRTGYVPPGHIVTLTGRERKTRTAGIRMDSVSREYRCACGYVGWSKHVDLMKSMYQETKDV